MSCRFCASGMDFSKEINCCSSGLSVPESTDGWAAVTVRTRVIHARQTQTNTAKTAIAQECFIGPPEAPKSTTTVELYPEDAADSGTYCFSRDCARLNWFRGVAIGVTAGAVILKMQPGNSTSWHRFSTRKTYRRRTGRARCSRTCRSPWTRAIGLA